MKKRDILESLGTGKITAAEAEKLLSIYAIEEVEDFARIDISRSMRKGIPEVVFAESKKTDEIKKIIKTILEKTGLVLVSRIKETDYDDITAYGKNIGADVVTGKNSSTLLITTEPIKPDGGTVGILAAGTSDIGVAEEARLVCEAMGCRCITGYDVGVAGIQRAFPILKKMISENAGCLVVVAGMEGALATHISSLVDIPIIGVPTSVGYGYGRGGVAALASMLQSCALGMAVVNIDGGVAAGSMAANIANRCSMTVATNQEADGANNIKLQTDLKGGQVRHTDQ